MDAKTRDLVLLAALWLFCTGHLVLGSVFFALSVAAAFGIAWEQFGADSRYAKRKKARFRLEAG
jgi:multisubunit Na+/H+ antiporter MnhE subunit